MCGLLGNDTDLREAVAMALRLALPASLQTSLVQMVLSPEAFPMPHQSSISRWRVLVDSAYMMWCREHLLPAGHIRYLMLDSSTQGGRDMEMLVVGSIARGDLDVARQMAEDLLLLRWAKGAFWGNRSELGLAIAPEPAPPHHHRYPTPHITHDPRNWPATPAHTPANPPIPDAPVLTC